MKITLNTHGLHINDQKIGLPCTLDEFLEILGPHDRKVFGTRNIHIYEDRGIYFFNNSNDKLSDGIMMSFRKDAGFQPEQGFSGTIGISGDEFDMRDPSSLDKLEKLFTFKPGETRAELKLGDYRISTYKKEGSLVNIGFHKMEAAELPAPKLNYDDKIHKTPRTAFDIEVVAGDVSDGWAFGQPKGITSEQWPRTQNNGMPMSHLFTVKVPEDYRVHGQEFTAISLFYSELDEYDAAVKDFIIGKIHEMPANAPHGFWNELDAYRKHKHPKSFSIAGEFGEEFMLLWLTQAEFEGEIPEFPGQNLPHDWSDRDFKAEAFLKLVARKDDPNTGKMPTDNEKDPDYIPMYSEKGEELGLERFWGKQHFGGTSSPCQAEPRGFTPFYLEFDESLGNANFGGDGVAQLDLLKNELTWQCG